MIVSPNLIATDVFLTECAMAEQKGLYEKAFEELAPYWNKHSNFPDTSGLSEHERAEVFLRCGSVVGFIGNSQMIPEGQLISIGLLENARHQFLNLGLTEKIAECENNLALAYSRTGQYIEAEDWLNAAYAHDLEKDHPVRLYSFVIECLLFLDRFKYETIIQKSLAHQELFARSEPLLQGCFQNHLGIAYRNLGLMDLALDHLKLARNYFRQADHKIYYAVTENNLAFLYLNQNQFKEAHACAQSAEKLFEEIDDQTRATFTLDTQAQIYLAEQKFEQALQYINQALEKLEKSDCYRKLVESYRTKIKILFALEKFPEALLVMTAAHNIAAMYISPQVAHNIIDDVARLINKTEMKSFDPGFAPKVL